jgi:hypothetical protein
MNLAPRIGVCAAAAAAVLAASPGARAQEPSSEAAATALFDEGRKLMGQHRYAEACPKLAESEQLAPSGGTLINLAGCYEQTGQTASAWVAWKDAAARANAAGKADAEKSALAHAAALEPSLAKLTVAVAAGSDVPGLVVKRDGAAVGHAEFGMPIPVDPGSHVVEATAPTKKAFSAKVDVAAKQTDARVSVALVDDPAAVAPPSPAAAAAPAAPVPASSPAGTPGGAPPSAEQPAHAKAWSTQKTVALVVAGAGVVGLGVGTAFGLVAKSNNDQALQPQNCRTASLCYPSGLQLTSDAKSAATVSDVALAAGGAAVVAGLVLWLTAPSSSPGAPTTTGVRVAPELARGYGGLWLRGGW